eukprot:scaffold47677_cov4758-Isochrysis_galbana.AAC.1
MSWRLVGCGKVKVRKYWSQSESELDKSVKSQFTDPNPDDLTMASVKLRGEIPIESGASWISPKCVEAQRLMFLLRGKATVLVRAARAVPNQCKL